MTEDAASRERTRHFLLVAARLGTLVTQAMVAAVEDPELARNLPILVLCQLDGAGPQRPTDIHTLTGLSSGGVTKLLDRLESKGMIERTLGAVPEDRRAVVITITPRGRDTVSRFAQAVETQLEASRAVADELRELLAG
jgi:DNA-binding MarR family transcriptional regulator